MPADRKVDLPFYKKNEKPTEPEWKTAAGFYVGDLVQLPDGREACIDEIILRNVNFYINRAHWTSNATIVRLDDEYWLDLQLTRIG